VQSTEPTLDEKGKQPDTGGDPQKNSTILRFVPGLDKICFDLSGFTLQEPDEFNSGRVSRYLKCCCTECNPGRLVFRTNNGWLGNGPQSAKLGDEVWILPRCKMPVVLRRKASGHFEFIGACYVHGFMQGEAITDPVQLQTEITIE
jgi:hypothetical protein